MNIEYYNNINEANKAKGFRNPYATTNNASSSISMQEDSIAIQEDPLARQRNNDIQYLGCRVWDSDTKGKTYCTQHTLPNGDIEYRMMAGQHFHRGDTIEEAPVKLMKEDDLFAKTIYSVCFCIDKPKGIYALPIGYSTCYRNSSESGKDGNIIYEYNDRKHTLKFISCKNIKKNDELILSVTDDDFENVVKRGQLEYYRGLEPLETISAARII